MPKHTIPGAVMLIRWWNGPPVAVILPPGSEPALQLSTTKAKGRFEGWNPRGPIETTVPTNAEKKFLLAKGMNPELFKQGRVFWVSDEIANRFNSEGKEFLAFAEGLGLSESDLTRFVTVKNKLKAFSPSNFKERKYLRALTELLTLYPPQKQRGRPGRIKAEDRYLIRADAQDLRLEGKSIDAIVRILAQRYELRDSYIKRILEDA